MIAKLKSWWIAHVAAITYVVYLALPAFQKYVNDHPKTTLGILIGAIIGAFAKTSPMTKVVPILLLLLIPMQLRAQAQPPQDTPLSHVVITGAAVSFKGVSGTQPASIMAAGLQLTTHFSAAYEQITVSGLPARYQLGVVNYTNGLNIILGKTLSSKFLFDTSNINLTFTAGGGKLLTPTANHIAETAGIALSYPVASHMSVQVFGYQVVHSPASFGLVTSNYTQQMSTGFNLYF